jgi:class 3 adenylate cyclase/tetratricopeptide (TPR) repeat protein
MDNRKQLEDALLALENQRAILGDEVVESSIALIHEKLSSLEGTLSHIDERKLVTVMFADISGFTAYSEKNDPEQVRRLINNCFAALVPVIEKYEGVVEKFIGDAILAIFGAPVAHEDDAQRANLTALEMMQVLEEFNLQNGVSLGIHFGINTGLVVAGNIGAEKHFQYGVTGDMVNLAARLEDLSERGQILVGPTTYRLTAAGFQYDILPPVRLKGKSEPVPVYRLLGRKSTPEMTGERNELRSPLIGRNVELRMLVNQVMELCQKQGGIIGLVAEAGLGKSRLMAEVRALCGGYVLWVEGRAISRAAGTSYFVAGKLLDSMLGAQSDANLTEVHDILKNYLQHAMPEEAAQVYPYLARLRDLPLNQKEEATLKDLLPEALKSRMQAAYAALIRTASKVQPLVLVLEDLHWADRSSLELVESLLPLSQEFPVLFVLVTRPYEGNSWDWYQKIAGQFPAGYKQVQLQPLTYEESSDLVEKLLNIKNMPGHVRELILNKSEGNPFFIEELLRTLIDNGLVIVEDGQATAVHTIDQLHVPDTLHGVIAARIDSLPVQQKNTLQTSAVIGRIFQVVVLEYLLQRENPGAMLDNAMEELQRRELIRLHRDWEYIFKHVMTRDVAYESLLIARRKILHKFTGEIFEMLFPDQLDELAAMLAFHFDVAQVHDIAAGYYMRAGDKAREKYANEEAIAFYRNAIQQWTSINRNEHLPALYEKVGIVFTLIGKEEEAVEAYQTALSYLSEDEVIRRARLYRFQGNARNITRKLNEMEIIYNRAAEILGQPDEANAEEWIDLQLDRIWCYYLLNKLNELSNIVDKARDVIAQHASDAQQARWYESLTIWDLRKYRYYKLPNETLENIRRGVTAAQSSGNRRIYGRAVTILGFVHLWRGEIDQAERYFRAAQPDVEAVGDIETLHIVLCYMALVGRKRNDIDLTRQWAQRSLDLALQVNNTFYQITSLGSLGWVEIRAGDSDQARKYLHRAFELQGQVASPIKFMAVGPALSIETSTGKWQDAIDHARILIHPSQQKMPDETEAALVEAVRCWDGGNQEEAAKWLTQSVALMSQQKLGYV